MNRYFYSAASGVVVEIAALGEGNRLTIMTPLFVTDPSEQGFAAARETAGGGASKEAPKKAKKRKYTKRAKAEIVDEDVSSGKKQRKCKLCGEPGHRSDTCPNGGQGTPPRSAVSLREALEEVTESTFDGIKKLQNDMNYPAIDAAKEAQLPLVIVKKIFASFDYQDFKDRII